MRRGNLSNNDGNITVVDQWKTKNSVGLTAVQLSKIENIVGNLSKIVDLNASSVELHSSGVIARLSGNVHHFGVVARCSLTIKFDGDCLSLARCNGEGNRWAYQTEVGGIGKGNGSDQQGSIAGVF